MKIDRDTRVFVAGHRGMVGSAVVRALEGRAQIITRTRAQLDLRRQVLVESTFSNERPDVVVLAAARVGGILYNARHQAEMLEDNLSIALNVLQAAKAVRCRRVVFLGSSCIYPRNAAQPIVEDELLAGRLEETNRGYAVAKIAGLELARAYAREGLLDAVGLMPTNLYGPNDSYDLERAHVLPALLRRFHDARVRGDSRVVVWGTGSPRREFLHVDDLARAVVLAIESDPGPGPFNVGSGSDVSIAELAMLIARIVGFEGEIEFDATKPDGTPRKLLDNARIRALGWAPTIGLEDGIRQTYRTGLERGGGSP